MAAKTTTKKSASESKWGKLPPAFKRKWVRALRSNKYAQGTGQLRERALDEYCCLGVACDLVGARTHINGIPLGYSSSRLLPPELRINHETAEHLSNMNDSGKSFAQIANWIEKNL